MKHLFISLIAACLLIGSCTDSYTVEGPASASEINTNGYAHIVKMATEVFAQTQEGSRHTVSPKVKCVTPWLTKDIYKEAPVSRSATTPLPDTLLYIVNFEDNAASAIVAESESVSGVIALIPGTNLYPEDEINDNSGLKYYLELYREAYLNGSIGKTLNEDDFKDYLPETAFLLSEDSEDWKTVTTYPNRLVQKWGIGNPYNKYCFTSDGKQAVASQLDIAIAQLFAYYKHPEYINGYKIDWENTTFSYPSSYAQADAAGRLVHEIGVTLNTHFYEDYSWELFVESTIDGVFVPSSSLQKWSDSYKYTCELFANETKMIHNLYSYGPALVTGAALDNKDDSRKYYYTWIVDGALAQQRTIDGKHELRFLYHCNWGDNGSREGYFASDAFNPWGPIGNTNYIVNHNVYTTYFIEKK